MRASLPMASLLTLCARPDPHGQGLSGSGPSAALAPEPKPLAPLAGAVDLPAARASTAPALCLSAAAALGAVRSMEARGSAGRIRAAC